MHAHAIYGFRSGIWASLDATYLNSSRTTVGGTQNTDLQQNWRLSGTLAFPLDARSSIRLYASSGVSSRTGNDYAGKRADAMRTLRGEGIRRHPYDREILFALATYGRAAANAEPAREHPRLLRELDPENRDFARLAAELGVGR